MNVNFTPASNTEDSGSIILVNLFTPLLAFINVDDWELTKLKIYYAWNESYYKNILSPWIMV